MYNVIPKTKAGYFISFFVLSVLVYILILSFRSGDFDLFMMSGIRFLNGENIYKPGYYNNHDIYYFYGYPFSMILSFFSFFPLPLVNFFWLCLNVCFLISIWRMVVAYVSLKDLSNKKRNILYICCAAFIIHFVNLNITAG